MKDSSPNHPLIRLTVKMSSSENVPRGEVVAHVDFFKPPTDGSEAENVIAPSGPHKTNYTDDEREITIQDLRGRESEVTLDHDGVLVVQGVPPSVEKDFVDDDSIKEKYYPELRELILANVPGSYTVVFFDHTIRRANPDAPRNPVKRAHIDQTATSVIQRIRNNRPDDAEKLLAGRYRLINVWRTLNQGPVESYPLAFALSPSVKDEDLAAIHHRYQSGYTGQTFGVKFSKEHQWRYVSGVKPDERLLLQCFDGQGLEAEGPRGARLAHAAFEDPRSGPNAAPRESIEVRALVFG